MPRLTLGTYCAANMDFVERECSTGFVGLKGEAVFKVEAIPILLEMSSILYPGI